MSEDMLDADIARAATVLWRHWLDGTRIDGLPAGCRPRSRAEGHAIQSEIVRLSGQPIAGWKIAATSVAGQRHIGVDGPLAGRLLAGRVLQPGASVSLAGNAMRVAEAEFAFRFARSLPSGSEDLSVGDVLDAVASVVPAIELPDSRYDDYARTGGPQLIADMACAWHVIFGEEIRDGWRDRDLAAHRVAALRNGDHAGDGRGSNVLGDPRTALAWLVNDVRRLGETIAAGHIVITGTCLPPVAIAPGDRLRMDFGDLGGVEVAFEG